MKEYDIRELVYTFPGTKVLDFELRSKVENHIIIEILSEKDYMKWEYFCEKVDYFCNKRVQIKKEYPKLTFIFPTSDCQQQYLLDLPVDPKTELEVAIFDFCMVCRNKYYLIEKPKRDSITIFLKITNDCNINCSYCYETPFRNMVKHNGILPLEDVDKIARMATSHAENVHIIFHGGEPTLAGVDYYRVVMGEIFTKYPYACFDASIQTNSINLDERWHALFRLCGISVGSSYNATDSDLRYGDKAGKISGSILNKIMHAKNDGVVIGNLEVLTSKNLPKLKDLYEFYKKLNISNTFLPIFNEGSAKKLSQELLQDEERYIEILTDYYIYWLKDQDVREDRIASDMLLKIYTGRGNVCDYRGECAKANLGMMSNGNLFPCDRPLYDRYDLGNIAEFESIEEIYNSAKYRTFLKEIDEKISSCKECEFYFYCYGGCPMRDIEETGYASKANDKYCREIQTNLLCMYRALTQVTYDELNPLAKFLVTINNRLLPNEIHLMVEELGLTKEFSNLKYDLTSTFSSQEWELFKALNDVNPYSGLFPYVYSYSANTGEALEDRRIVNIREALRKRKYENVENMEGE